MVTGLFCLVLLGARDPFLLIIAAIAGGVRWWLWQRLRLLWAFLVACSLVGHFSGLAF